MMFDGRELRPISAATEAFVRAYLPRPPPLSGPLWVGDTCWVATYTQESMQPQRFAGWECLNPCQEAPNA